MAFSMIADLDSHLRFCPMLQKLLAEGSVWQKSWYLYSFAITKRVSLQLSANTHFVFRAYLGCVLSPGDIRKRTALVDAMVPPT